jgi:Mlc titration factor MtfA (ptsG expression regulator)
MDAYGAESLPEFFAVACEAYFVQRERFAQEFPTLPALFDAFFRPGQIPPTG